MEIKLKHVGLNTLFGLNGIGKDTIAEELRKLHPEITVTTMSRAFMYVLGLTSRLDVAEKVHNDCYKKLGAVPHNKMVEIENNEYRRLLENFQYDKNGVILLGHLITALHCHYDSQIKYITEPDRVTPTWLVEANKNLIQLTSPLDLIKERRQNDPTRHPNPNIAQIAEHQSLCDAEWERIGKLSPSIKKKMCTVENINLTKAVNKIDRIVF